LAPPGASAEQSSLRFNGFSDAFGLLAPGLGLLLTRIKAVWLTTSPCCVLCMLPSNPCRASVALACVLAGCPIPVTGQTVKAVAIFFWLGMLRFLPGVSRLHRSPGKACFQEKAARLGFRRRESSALIKSGPALIKSGPFSGRVNHTEVPRPRIFKTRRRISPLMWIEVSHDPPSSRLVFLRRLRLLECVWVARTHANCVGGAGGGAVLCGLRKTERTGRAELAKVRTAASVVVL
jgi:hypothetical protein